METSYFCILARIALGGPALFVAAIGAVASATGGQAVGEPMEWLLTEWFAHFDRMGGSTEGKKLVCLGLTALLEPGLGLVEGDGEEGEGGEGSPEWMLRRLQDLMTVWTDVVRDCVEFEEGDVDGEGERGEGGVGKTVGEGKDTLIYEWVTEPFGPESAEEGRRRAVSFFFSFFFFSPTTGGRGGREGGV